jgi:hypothetical protein
VFRGFLAVASLGVIAVIMLATGCGGSSGGGTGAASPGGGSAAAPVTTVAGLTKPDFVKQANAVCERGSEEIRAGSEAFKKEKGLSPGASLSKAQEEELVSKVVVPSVRKQAEGVAKLGAPEADLGTVRAIVERLEDVVEAGEEDPANILQEGDGNSLAEVNKVTKAYGVDECMQP